MTVDTLTQALQAAGLTPEDYSGRNLFGRYCVCTNVSDLPEAVAKIMAANVPLHAELVPLMAAAKTDSMGPDTVLYWPKIEWEGERPSLRDDEADATH